MSPRPARYARALLGLCLASALLAGAARADDADCLECHATGAGVLDSAKELDAERYAASLHAQMGLGCADCHAGDFESVPHEGVQAARCSNCHTDVPEVFATSVHATVGAFTGEGCRNCHGLHDVRAVDDPEARTAAANQSGTCGNCHANLEVIGEYGLDETLVERYRGSVHGLHTANGDVEPAICADCHGGHDIKLASHPESRINPFRIPQTCGQCHEQIAAEYDASVHGRAFARGRTTSPNCTTCHGIHSIKHVPHDEASPREAHLVRTTCVACHSSSALMNEFDVTSTRVGTYQASYHGLVSRRGDAAVADCASCHGIHAIFPSTDPRSTVAPERLQETCGNCHPNASTRFAQTPVHYDADLTKAGALIVEWVKKIYWILLFVVLGGMVAHNLVIVGWYVRRKWREESAKTDMRRRFDRSQVLQHAALVTSFALLVISGFMLAYPGTWWSHLLSDLGVSEPFRRWVHRGAAAVMTLASIYHLYWLLGTPYGRAELRRIAPRARDVREVVQNMRFHLGLSEHHAAFGKYDYPAKAEYWALVWGTIVMILSGAILLFPIFSTSFLPAWVVKVAEVVHLFEAWLATLAILIFHFFYVFGHPEVYPFNFAMFHGGMRRRMAAHHHPTWDESEDAPPPDHA